MTRRNPVSLSDRVRRAAAEALAARQSVTPLDLLVGLRWVDPGTVKRWQTGMLACLEDAIQTNPARIAKAMALFRDWASQQGLLAGEVQYVARTPQREALRFTRDGDPQVEAAFRTQFLSPSVPEKQRERLSERANRPPELVVISPRNRDWTCHRCGGTGDLLIMEQPGPCCLRCAGLDDLEFLGRGDALLTRRARAKSARSAVVVRFSRTRKRYERQGLLVEPAALAAAEQEVEAQRSKSAGANAGG